MPPVPAKKVVVAARPGQLSIYEFGRQLVTTQDLDPSYAVLWNAGLNQEEMCKFLVAYFCFYHMGTAAWISEQPDYWEALMLAASTKEYPRSSERRHFRGGQATRAVQFLRELGESPTGMIHSLGHKKESPTFMEVAERIQQWLGFGSWISFKAADILERLDICPVRFAPEDVFNMFDSPKKGAEEMAKFHGPAPAGNALYMWAYDSLIEKIGELKAPPRFERGLNIQECETILCKFHSHTHGRYEVGKDIHEIKEGLGRPQFAKCQLAHRLIKSGEKGGLW